MKEYSLRMIDSYTAVGGYKDEDIDKGMKAEGYGPTTVGLYTIRKIEPHKSGGRWATSVVPWEAETKIDNHNVVKVFIRGKWVRLSSLKGWQGSKSNPWSEKKTYETLLATYDDLFNRPNISVIAKLMSDLKIDRKQLFKIMKIGHIPSTPIGREVPDKWMLNDFGHKSIKYFVDRDHDGIYDKGEKLSQDFIHSSPHTEVWDDLGLLSRALFKAKTLKRNPFAGTYMEFEFLFNKSMLAYSHGCIHAFPNDIDEMIEKGYLVKKAIVEVHKFGDKSKSLMRVKRWRTLKHEVHFYPTDFKIVVYETQRLFK